MDRGGRYLVVTVIALVIAVYLAFQIIGVFFRLVFIAAAVALGLSAWRTWRSRS
jgi:hypothetical protein